MATGADSGTDRTAASAAPVARVGVVVIGRNEGERLVRCLASVLGTAGRVIYVDSGSEDGSPETAARLGAEVVRLDPSRPFTAARGRNAGLALLARSPSPPDHVQFVDGDCELVPGWLAAGRDFLDATPRAAVAFGRLRERFPEASVYNALCDREWQATPGRVRTSGGIAMMRMAALDGTGGFREDLAAGEEPDLCTRLRGAGWEVWCLDAEMGFHDAGLERFSQWWRRTRRGGHAWAEAWATHGSRTGRYFMRHTLSALFWGLGVPVAALGLGALVTPWGLLLLLAWPVQAVRIARATRREGRPDWLGGVFGVLAKLPEAEGVLRYAWKRFARR